MMRCSVPAESNHRKNWLTRLSIMQRIFSPPTAASASCPHRAPCAAADDLKSSALLWGALHKAENPTWQTVPLGVCAGPRSADYLTDMGVDQKKHCFHWRQTEQDQANLNSSRLAEPLAQALHRLALITMQSGYFRRRAASRSACAAASPPLSTLSILLKTRIRGTPLAPISSMTFSVTSNCRSNPESLASTTWSSSDASSASSSVDLNEATSPCGRFLMKPTVSLTRMRGRLSGWRARTVVSSVAKSLSSTSTSLPVRARIRVDLPAFV